jgi:hypothetical protein
MIDWRLDAILAGLESGSLLGPATFAAGGFDRVLADRQGQEYLGDYSRVGDELGRRWQVLPVHPDHRELCEAIHRRAYESARAALSACAEDADVAAELATFIGQEFDFIAQSRAVQWADGWVDGLWAVYKAQRLPSGPWTWRLLPLARSAGGAQSLSRAGE